MKKIGVGILFILLIVTIRVASFYVLKEYNYIKDYYYKAPTPLITSVFLDKENNINVYYNIPEYKFNNKIYYLYKTNDEVPLANDQNWILNKSNNFKFLLDQNRYYVYLKNEDNEIIKVDDTDYFGRITSLNINKDKVYLAINGKYKVSAKYTYIGYIEDKLTWRSENSNIASVSENGEIKGLKNGTTKIYAKIKDKEISTSVTVTDLITTRPNNYDSKKSYLGCDYYSKEDNDLLDEILKDRINEKGYKTRAGVVEAARFLTLEFPYKIRYFSENGRGSTNGVDGEGRYYHVGLYLDESRYSKIGKKSSGPKTWGCKMYSRPSHGYRANGFDCSGFVSWVLLNGGFDVGDIGAGLAPHLDLTDYGERIKFNSSVVSSGKVKVGDLLSSGGVGGGHIAIIVGEDDSYYYVAESLWTPPNVAVVVIPYSKKTIFNRYYYVMLMDSYYKKDGDLSKMWY